MAVAKMILREYEGRTVRYLAVILQLSAKYLL